MALNKINYGLLSDEVKAKIGSVKTTEESWTGDGAKTAFTLTSGTYNPNTQSILVFVEGIKQVSGTNFTETNSSTITFSEAPSTGSLIEIVYFMTNTDSNVDITTLTGFGANVSDPINTLTSDLADNIQYTSVLSCGAKGDGVTDDSDAINQAISQATNGTVIILSGYNKTFLISKPIVMTDKQEVTLMGVGQVTINNPNGTEAIQLFGTSFGTTRKCKIKGITITGTTSSAPSDIYIKNSFRGFEVSYCTINSSAPYGIRVEECIKGKIYKNEISGDNKISGVLLSGGGTSSTTTVTVEDNYIWSDASGTGGTGFMKYGIQIQSAQSNRVINNVIEGLGSYGVYVSHDSPRTTQPYSIKNRVLYNYFERMDTAIYITTGGNSHQLISNEVSTVNYGIFTDESQTKVLFGVPYKIHFGSNSSHCIAIEPYLDGTFQNILGTYLIDSGANNQALFSMNKTMNLLNNLAIRGGNNLSFYDNSGNYKGSVDHSGTQMILQSEGQFYGKPYNQSNSGIFMLMFSGATSDRPASGLYTGMPYFDTTLGYQINYNGSHWVNSTGAQV